jgi:hypothetical protein
MMKFSEDNFAQMSSMLDRAMDMLFAASGALKDRKMEGLANAVSELAMEINERTHSEDAA